jgi:hypothetical protein
VLSRVEKRADHGKLYFFWNNGTRNLTRSTYLHDSIALFLCSTTEQMALFWNKPRFFGTNRHSGPFDNTVITTASALFAFPTAVRPVYCAFLRLVNNYLLRFATTVRDLTNVLTCGIIESSVGVRLLNGRLREACP